MNSETSIQQYLEEGLVALLPVYRAGVEGTEVFTLVQTYQLYHSLSWALKLIARYCCLDLTSLRRRSGALLGVRHHIPLPFSEGLVLLPVKVRDGDRLGETTVGYLNFLQVEGMEEASSAGAGDPAAETPGPAPRNGGDRSSCRSRINCRGPIIIHSLNTASTIKAKLRQGEIMRDESAGRQKLLSAPGPPFTGLSGAVLQGLLPSCDCFLNNIMLLLLKNASQPEK